MKMISKATLLFLLSFIFCTSYAFQVASPRNNLQSKATAASQVYLVNLTRESYMSYSVYRNTGERYSLPLLAAGTSQDKIYYPIVYPVYDVCLDVVQNYTGAHVYQGCIASGTIYIHYAVDGKTVLVS
jgi:hypothetical protein